MPRLIVVTPPVPKARARVVVRGGRGRAYTPAKTLEAEWRIRTQWLAEHGQNPMRGPLCLDVVIHLAMPVSIPKKRRAEARPVTRPDTDNYLKTVLDALNGVAYADDSQVVRLSAEKKYAVDGPPRWELVCEPIVNS